MLKQIRGHWYKPTYPFFFSDINYIDKKIDQNSRHLPLAENLTGRLDIHVGVFVFVFLPQCLAIIM
jgi:hypothetical protein